MNAVSYLNTAPLVWGMLEGPQKDLVNLSFSIPAECARQIELGTADIGLVPVAEIARQGLEIVGSVGITCLGPVRSILLFSRVPFGQIKTLAVDSSSRTSVQLARVILRERYGANPQIHSWRPVLSEMLAEADAALVIGDPALTLNPQELGFACLDLGEEWFHLTRLPMVFAAWAGKPGIPATAIEQVTAGSYEFGRAHLHQIAEQQFRIRGITLGLAERYLSHHIRFEIGTEERRGLEAFLEFANLGNPAVAGKI